MAANKPKKAKIIDSHDQKFELGSLPKSYKMIGRYDGMTEPIPNTLITFFNALMRSCVTLLLP